MRTETIRSEILRLLEKRPFDPFEIDIENGDKLVVEHPETVAVGNGDDKGKFSNRVYILGKELVTVTTLDAISAVVEIDSGAPMGE